ncbi:MAG: glycosyltransferase family 39 protein [Sedimentisphaerales bacterium]|nr:glycosyltransferase family 39 protein [Sedimentisphaerales bacterium]
MKIHKETWEIIGLIIILLVLGLLFQGSRGIWQPDEGYYTGTAMTMMKNGTFIIPYLGEEEIFLDKPPLIYWGIIAGIRLFGQTEFGVRFAHAISFILTSLSVGLLSFAMFRHRRMALFSSLIYATMIVPFFAANFITPDTHLALWTTLGGLLFWKSVQTSGRSSVIWKMLLCTVMGLGFLSKGPAVLIPCTGMFIFLLIRRQIIRYFLTFWSLVGLLVFGLVGLWWYVWISIKLPGAFSYFFDNQIWGRLVSDRYERNPGLHGALIYVPVLLLGSLPWSIVWWQEDRIRKIFLNKQWWIRLKNNPQVLFLTTWTITPLIVLALASSKLGFYALPVFAPLAILTAGLWINKYNNIPVSSLQWHKEQRRIIGLICSLILILPLLKLSLSYYPHNNDMRAFWAEIERELPNGQVELCTIHDRADGLIFYTSQQVEHLTYDQDPYPTFLGTEHLQNEIFEPLSECEKIVLIIQDLDELSRIKNFLDTEGIQHRIINLSGERRLVYLNPTAPNPAL